MDSELAIITIKESRLWGAEFEKLSDPQKIEALRQTILEIAEVVRKDGDNFDIRHELENKISGQEFRAWKEANDKDVEDAIDEKIDELKQHIDNKLKELKIIDRSMF